MDGNYNDDDCSSLDVSSVRSSISDMLKNSVSMLEMNEIKSIKKFDRVGEDFLLRRGGEQDGQETPATSDVPNMKQVPSSSAHDLTKGAATDRDWLNKEMSRRSAVTKTTKQKYEADAQIKRGLSFKVNDTSIRRSRSMMSTGLNGSIPEMEPTQNFTLNDRYKQNAEASMTRKTSANNLTKVAVTDREWLQKEMSRRSTDSKTPMQHQQPAANVSMKQMPITNDLTKATVTDREWLKKEMARRLAATQGMTEKIGSSDMAQNKRGSSFNRNEKSMHRSQSMFVGLTGNIPEMEPANVTMQVPSPAHDLIKATATVTDKDWLKEEMARRLAAFKAPMQRQQPAANVSMKQVPASVNDLTKATATDREWLKKEMARRLAAATQGKGMTEKRGSFGLTQNKRGPAFNINENSMRRSHSMSGQGNSMHRSQSMSVCLTGHIPEMESVSSSMMESVNSSMMESVNSSFDQSPVLAHEKVTATEREWLKKEMYRILVGKEANEEGGSNQPQSKLRPSLKVSNNSMRRGYHSESVLRRVGSQSSILKSSAAYNDNSQMHQLRRGSDGIQGQQLRRKTSFSSIEIREYPITLGDQVPGARGPPISIDWEHNKEKTQMLELENYEDTRAPRRKRHEMHMADNLRRWRLLREKGYSMKEMEKAAKAAEAVRKQRKKSIESKPALSKVKKKIGQMISSSKNEADRYNSAGSF